MSAIIKPTIRSESIKARQTNNFPWDDLLPDGVRDLEVECVLGSTIFTGLFHFLPKVDFQFPGLFGQPTDFLGKRDFLGKAGKTPKVNRRSGPDMISTDPCSSFLTRMLAAVFMLARFVFIPTMSHPTIPRSIAGFLLPQRKTTTPLETRRPGLLKQRNLSHWGTGPTHLLHIHIRRFATLGPF